MTEGKLAAQVGHVTKELGKLAFLVYGSIVTGKDDVIIVLGLRQNKFNEKLKEISNGDSHSYIQKDAGFTEVDKGTITVFGYITN